MDCVRYPYSQTANWCTVLCAEMETHSDAGRWDGREGGINGPTSESKRLGLSDRSMDIGFSNLAIARDCARVMDALANRGA